MGSKYIVLLNLLQEQRLDINPVATFQQRRLFNPAPVEDLSLLFAPLTVTKDEGSSSQSTSVPSSTTTISKREEEEDLPGAGYEVSDSGKITDYRRFELIPLSRKYVEPSVAVKGWRSTGPAAIAREIVAGRMDPTFGIPKLLESIDLKRVGRQGGYNSKQIRVMAKALGINGRLKKAEIEAAIIQRKMATGQVPFPQDQMYGQQIAEVVFPQEQVYVQPQIAELSFQ